MARRNQMDDFMVGGSRGPSANRPDPNAGRRPGDPYIIAQDSRPVGTEGLSQNEIKQFEDFLNVSGRGDKIRNRTNISGRDAAKLARMQFDQFRNLQRGGDYAPSLKPGMTVPGGTIARRPEARGGLAGFLGRGGFLGNFLGDIGGNAPKTIQASGGSGRRGRGSFINLNTGRSSAINPNVGRDDNVLSRMITERPSANVPAGGIMNNFPIMDNLIETRPASFDELSDKPASPTVTAQPGGTIAGTDMTRMGEGADLTDAFTDIPKAVEQPVSTVDTMTDFDRALSDAIALQTAAQDAADATELAEINMLMRGRELADRDARNQALQQSIGQAVAAAQVRDAERAAALDAVNQAALEETRRQAALEALFTEAGLENMVGDGPVLELPPGTDPIDDFDMLTLGTTPMPPADSPYTEKLEEIFTERDLGDINFMREIDKGVIEPALIESMVPPAPETVLTPTSATREVTVGDERARLIGEERTRQEIENQLVSQGVSRPQARMRANKAVYGFGDATPRTGMAIARGADPLAAAFEAGLPPL